MEGAQETSVEYSVRLSVSCIATSTMRSPVGEKPVAEENGAGSTSQTPR